MINANGPDSNKQVATIKTDLAQRSVNIENYKSVSNTWNQAFTDAYNALPTYGGTITIPGEIEITSSINLISLGSKKVSIVGVNTAQNMNELETSKIKKNGNFDAVVLNGGSCMRNITVIKKSGVVGDTGVGVWVAGLGCILENVAAISHGGDGIRVGNKGGSSYNCNISRLMNCKSYGNGGWGIHYSDDTAPTLPNANAAIIFGADCRDNQTGGIKMENCIDSQIYSPDCESNVGTAGIYLGDKAQGIDVYSPYTENPSCTNEIYLHSGSKYCVVHGYRSGTLNDSVTDLGTANLVYGRLGAKVTAPFVKGRIMYNELGISSKDSSVLGNYFLRQLSDRSMEIRLENLDVNSQFSIVHGDATKRLTVEMDELRINDKDALNKLYSKKPSSSSTTLNANTVTKITVNAFSSTVGDMVVATPLTVLPDGIMWSAAVESANTVAIRLHNTTGSPISLGAITWNLLLLDGRQIV